MSVQVSHIFNKCALSDTHSAAFHQPAQHILPTRLQLWKLSSSPPPNLHLPLLAGELQAAGFWYLAGTSLSALGQLRGRVAEALFLCRVVPLMHLRAPGVEEASKLLFTAPALHHELQQPQRM
jgi:hypothetical protein